MRFCGSVQVAYAEDLAPLRPTKWYPDRSNFRLLSSHNSTL